MADLRRLRRAVAGTSSDARHADEQTRYEIADSARIFSRRAREVMDDKLTFTAALVRAGEVEAANRLLSEVERDVRHEEATLFERVNEARAAASVRRQAMTRFRLARVLATAMVGASLLAFSAVGMAMVAWLDDRSESEFSSRGTAIEAVRVLGQSSSAPLTPLRIAGVAFELDGSQLKRFERLTNGTGNPAELQAFLLGVLPPELANRVHRALTSVSQAAAPLPAAAETTEAVAEAERRARKKAKQAQQSQPKPSAPSESGNGEGSEGNEGNEGNGGNGDDEDDEDDRDESGGPLPGLP